MNINNDKIYNDLTYPNVYPHDDTYDISNETRVKELFDNDALDRTLLDSLISNYNGLYVTQQTSFGMMKVHIKLSDFKKMTLKSNGFSNQQYPKKYVYYMDYSLVHISAIKAFRKSKLYNTIIDQSIISKNADIFSNNYLIFLNGDLLNNTEIIVDDNKIGIIINVGLVSNDFISSDEMTNLITNDGYITFCTVPNYTIKHLTIPVSLSTTETFDNKLHSMMSDSTIISYNSGSSKVNTLIRVTKDDSIIDIFSDILDPATTDKMFKLTKYINMKFIEFIDKPMKITTSDKYFKLSDFNMPIPTSNIMIFGYNDSYKFCEDEETNLYYPNIYGISSSMSSYDIYVFYMDFSGSKEKYHNDISLYTNNIADIISEYKNNTVPDIIKSYEPIDFKYSIPSYEKDNPNGDSVLSYKLDKLTEITTNNYKNIVRYMKYIIPNNKSYIDLSKVSLDNITRTNVLTEIPDGTMKFDKPKIVISIINPTMTNLLSGFRVFIDGYFVPMESVYITKYGSSYYIYIDKSYVKSNSIIEIEKYYGYDDRPTIAITKSNLEIEFNKPNTTLYKSDVYAINSETKEIIDSSNYDVYLNVDGIGYVKVTDDYRILSDKFKVVYTGDIGDNIVSVIARKKLIRTIEYISGYDTATYTIASMMNHDNPSISNYRFFRNGRLVDMSKYISVSQSSSTINMDKFVLSFRNNIGDSLIIDKTSEYRNLVYSQAVITDNGFVEITSEIKFPLDLRWYDIYLNGLKLTPYNIDIISPNSFYIKNVNTKKDLRIYLVNLSAISPFIPPINISDDINNKLMSIPEIKALINSKYTDITETLDDVIPDGIKLTDDDMKYVSLYKDYLCSNYINANIPQITDEIKVKYPDMIDEDGILYLDSSPHSESDILFMLNSNITLKE